MVEIKTSKEIHPKIYAYTTPTVTSNEGWIKYWLYGRVMSYNV